jgi:hypothetical protein
MLLPAVFTAVSRVVLYPVYATQTWLRESTNSFPTYLRDKAALEEEIVRLENELVTTKTTDVTLQRLYEENNTLRTLLNSEAEERIAAAVVARPNQLPYDFLQIDRGREHGVAEGAAVYSGNDTVIGIVAHVDRQFAFVELFTTPDFEATAFVSGSNVIATLEGMGAGVARVRIPQGIPILMDSLVYVPSIEPGVYGRITYVESEPTQPEQYGYIVPDKSISSLQYVAVATTPLVPPEQSIVREEIESIIAESLRIEGMNPSTVDVAETETATSTPATSTNSAITSDEDA